MTTKTKKCEFHPRSVAVAAHEKLEPLCYRCLKTGGDCARDSCLAHPRYKAVKPPTADCKVCKELYAKKQA